MSIQEEALALREKARRLYSDRPSDRDAEADLITDLADLVQRLYAKVEALESK